jgi:hypothetical protein
MNSAFIFIDEFGHPHLDTEKPGSFSHFIYSAFIIDSADELKARELREKLCKKYNLGPNIKSNKLGSKYFEKRLNILSDLVKELDFTIDVLVVDKNKLNESKGLSNHQVFYKFFQSTFVTRYNTKFRAYSIWADQVGTDFKIILQDYVRSKGAERDLFYPDRYYALKDDINEEKLIQFADIICGSIGKIFCVSHADPRAKEIYEILHSRMSVDYFPYFTTRLISSDPNPEIDQQIRNINQEIINKYLDNTWSIVSSEKTVLLKYMILNAQINPDRLIPTYDLRIYMSNYFSNYTEERLRLLIRDLRYEGVLIISHSGKPGYKLASCYDDIKEHFDHFMGYVIPMLNKIKVLNKSISENSYNKINPIEKDPNFLKLREILLALGKTN